MCRLGLSPKFKFRNHSIKGATDLQGELVMWL